MYGLKGGRYLSIRKEEIIELQWQVLKWMIWLIDVTALWEQMVLFQSPKDLGGLFY